MRNGTDMWQLVLPPHHHPLLAHRRCQDGAVEVPVKLVLVGCEAIQWSSREHYWEEGQQLTLPLPRLTDPGAAKIEQICDVTVEAPCGGSGRAGGLWGLCITLQGHARIGCVQLLCDSHGCEVRVTPCSAARPTLPVGLIWCLWVSA